MSLDPRRWSLIVKAPALVAALMIVVSAVASYQVLERLSAAQSRNLETLSGAYLDGVTSALLPHLLRDDTWEVFESLERAKGLYRGLNVAVAIVSRLDGTIVASTLPETYRTEEKLPPHVMAEAPVSGLEGATWLTRPLTYQDRGLGTIYVGVDTRELIEERRAVLMTLIATNAFLTIFLAGLGWLLVRRLLRPAETLSAKLEAATSGALSLIPDAALPDPTTEFGRLFRRYNAMAEAVNEREELSAKLAEEETLASLGRLASVVAHEINNPLGGLLNTVDTLKHHGGASDVRGVSLDILERGLQGIRQVVQTMLALYRPDRNPRPLMPHDFEDLRLLIAPELRRRGQFLEWSNELAEPVSPPSGPVRQSTLNLLLNASQASPDGATVRFSVRHALDEAVILVEDSGPGMPEAQQSFLTRPGIANMPTPGLGLWMIKRMVLELGGRIKVEPASTGGARVMVAFPAFALSTEEMRHVA
jgi:signal transduction histidine kinase